MTKKIGLKETLKTVKLADKVDLTSSKRNSNISFDIDKAVNNIHTIPKVKLYRLSIDVPENVYEDVKIKVARQKKTVRDYVLELIDQDLRI